MVVYKCDLCESLIEKPLNGRKYQIVCTEKNHLRGSPYTMDICPTCYRRVEKFIDALRGIREIDE